MSATIKRLKKKELQKNLDNILKSILKEHEGDDTEMFRALITAKQQLQKAGATDK